MYSSNIHNYNVFEKPYRIQEQAGFLLESAPRRGEKNTIAFRDRVGEGMRLRFRRPLAGIAIPQGNDFDASPPGGQNVVHMVADHHGMGWSNIEDLQGGLQGQGIGLQFGRGIAADDGLEIP